MIGVLINTAAVLIGSVIGLLCGRGISKKIADAVMTAIGVCTLFIGISGALSGENILIAIGAMVLGVIVGTVLDIDDKLNRLGIWTEEKLQERGGWRRSSAIAQGFVTGCLLFCIGAMTVVGCLDAGLTGDCDMLYTKSLLDFISSMMLSVSLGIGVLFSAIFVLVFQGVLVLLAGVLQPVLTASAIAEMTCVGSLMILMLGLNLLGIRRSDAKGTFDFKVANFLPALVIAPMICYVLSLF